LKNTSTPPHTIISLSVQIAVWEFRPAGVLMVLVPVQSSVAGSYLPPLFNWEPGKPPPQTIISVPVHTAVWLSRSSGALFVLVAVQLLVAGVYLPPVFTSLLS
jgi:hypothetical protein